MPETATASSKRLTVQDVAELYGYNQSTIYKWVRIGRIPCIRIHRQIRFRLSDIEKWEEENTTGKL